MTASFEITPKIRFKLRIRTFFCYIGIFPLQVFKLRNSYGINKRLAASDEQEDS